MRDVGPRPHICSMTVLWLGFLSLIKQEVPSTHSHQLLPSNYHTLWFKVSDDTFGSGLGMSVASSAWYVQGSVYSGKSEINRRGRGQGPHDIQEFTFESSCLLSRAKTDTSTCLIWKAVWPSDNIVIAISVSPFLRTYPTINQ